MKCQPENLAIRIVHLVRRLATIVAVLAALRFVATIERQPNQHQPAAIPQQRVILTDKTPTIIHEYPTN